MPFMVRAALDHVVLFPHQSTLRVCASALLRSFAVGFFALLWAWERKRERRETYPRMQRQHRPVVKLHFHNPDHADAVVDGYRAVHLGFAARREVDD